MTVLKHELKQNRLFFVIWTAVICFMLAISVILFPEMKKEMDMINEAFASMGAFTAAFGMDKLNFGTISGYYTVECGNVLGLGGAFFASLIGIAVICKEEKNKTSEFLFAHPVSRARILTEKLLSVFVQVVLMNMIIYVVSIVSLTIIGEDVPWKQINLIHLAYLILQLELASVCFFLSAFIRKGNIGIGLGIAAAAYFLNIISNIASSASFLKYVTPYGYCDGAELAEKGALDPVKTAIGVFTAIICVIAAYIKYKKKDLH